MDDLSHLTPDGVVHMVDVGDKSVTQRTATATATVSMEAGTVARLFSDDLPKGDAIATVRLAAIQATKRTPDLIPLCHPLMISGVTVEISNTDTTVDIDVTVRVDGKTGVEMEAMTGASVGALTLYDMIKGVDRTAEITSVRLEHKAGGRTGEWHRG